MRVFAGLCSSCSSITVVSEPTLRCIMYELRPCRNQLPYYIILAHFSFLLFLLLLFFFFLPPALPSCVFYFLPTSSLVSFSSSLRSCLFPFFLFTFSLFALTFYGIATFPIPFTLPILFTSLLLPFSTLISTLVFPPLPTPFLPPFYSPILLSFVFQSPPPLPSACLSSAVKHYSFTFFFQPFPRQCFITCCDGYHLAS